METKEHFLNEILQLNPNLNTEVITKAYEKAISVHEGQFRKSGEPYVVHPLAVAKILADLGMDEQTIVAGLLHDTVEDTPYTIEDLEADFGKDTAHIVDGVTKLGFLIVENKEQRQAENLKKMFLAMSKDIRVLIVKLADRLHNLRTIDYMSEAQIEDKCRETLDIYAPLAERLGIYAIKFELEDTALKYLDPDFYYALAEQVKIKKSQREEYINKVMEEIRESISDFNLKFEITGRSKHFYSIYRKMKYQHKQLDEIFDLTAVRIIVDNVKDCYLVLGIVHTMWKPIPGRFKDYIAMPKPNLYQSLHTTVLGDNGEPFEIQIRTHEMHQVAEYGIAAHWKYKEGVEGEDKEETKLAWLRQTLEWQSELNDSTEFVEAVKMDLFSNQVFVLTPGGDVIDLPAGSTPLDFAFKIHSAIGVKCIGAKVNGKMVPIDYNLENGNIVEIITSANSKGPSIDWLKIVKSSNARNKIRQWLKKENKTENADKGRDMLEKYIKRRGYEVQEILHNQWVNKAAKSLNYSTAEDLYTAVSYGGVLLNKIFNMLEGYHKEEKAIEQKKKAKQDSAEGIVNKKKSNAFSYNNNVGISVKGVDNLLIRISKCCNPVPGDEIVGFITKGRGISVHRTDCINMTTLPEDERNRLIDIEWDTKDKDVSYDVDIVIVGEDRKGLFADLSRTCEDMEVHITGVNAKSARDGVINITMTVSIENIGHMEKLLRSLKNIQGVLKVYRSKV